MKPRSRLRCSSLCRASRSPLETLPLANPRERASWNEVEQNDLASLPRYERRRFRDENQGGITRTIHDAAPSYLARWRKRRLRKFDASISNALGIALEREICTQSNNGQLVNFCSIVNIIFADLSLIGFTSFPNHVT